MDIRLRSMGNVVLGTATVTETQIVRDNVVIGTAYRRRDAMYEFKNEVLSRARLLELVKSIEVTN